MTRQLIILSASLSLLAAEESTEVPLFNGKDLTGWDVLIDKEKVPLEEQKIFAVKEGEIHVYPTQEADSKQKFAGLVTKKSYENYHLKVEFKWGEKKFAPRDKAVRDAGVLVHVFEPDKIWPASIELQIQEGDTGDLWIIGCQASTTIGPDSYGYTPKGKLTTRPENPKQKYAKFARSYSWEKPGWNLCELIVRGDHAIFKVNGKVVNEAIDSKKVLKDGTTTPLTSGHILLQAEGAELFYRNITLTPLKVEAAD